jgi:hypothetical protein
MKPMRWLHIVFAAQLVGLGGLILACSAPLEVEEQVSYASDHESSGPVTSAEPGEIILEDPPPWPAGEHLRTTQIHLSDSEYYYFDSHRLASQFHRADTDYFIHNNESIWHNVSDPQAEPL